MPREQRKRGKRHKKADEVVEQPEPQETFEEPSWIVANENVEDDTEFPFGVVDPDVKAYFRTVDGQIKEWQAGHARVDTEAADDQDPNQGRRMFLTAALTELSGKELQLATDADCSVILERMLFSMDDFSRRVFLDSLADGSFAQLACHRFASHVCQTLLMVSADTISRESKGHIPAPPKSGDDVGVLRSMTELITVVWQELLPQLSTLIIDPFASHVIRALLLLLAGDLVRPQVTSSNVYDRSKKSAKYRAQQGPMTSILEERSSTRQRATPPSFRQMAIEMVTTIKEQMDSNEIRALASHNAASPVAQILIEVEAKCGQSDRPGSLMDNFLAGMISQFEDVKDVQPSDYVETLLRDPIASHILESILSNAPAHIMSRLWAMYFSGKLAKLAVHPVTNFVVASTIGRMEKAEFLNVLTEMKGRWPAVLKHSRTGPLRAVIERATELRDGTDEALEAFCSAFEVEVGKECGFVVPCVLSLKSLPSFRSQIAEGQTMKEYADQVHEPARPIARSKRRAEEQSSAITMQGSLILQAMLRMPQPFNQIIIDSIAALTVEERIAFAHNPISSRVFDAFLDSPNVPFRPKRLFITAFIGHYHLLVDDRLGSRIGDACWVKADTFLREKIALSLVKQETFLAASHFGRFFARKLHLALLQRKPEDWKLLQSRTDVSKLWEPEKSRTQRVEQLPVPEQAKKVSGYEPPKERKTTKAESDEIDALFKSAGKKRKRTNGADAAEVPRAALAVEPVKPEHAPMDAKGDRSLAQVLGAIKETRTDEKSGGRKKRRQD